MKKPKSHSIHPNAQIIITGHPLTPEQAQEVMEFSKELSVSSWCAADGSIGHIDGVRPHTTFDKLYTDLLELSMRFSFLDMGVTVMSGPPGTFTQPVLGFSLKKSSLKRSELPHVGHPAPKRMKSPTTL